MVENEGDFYGCCGHIHVHNAFTNLLHPPESIYQGKIKIIVREIELLSVFELVVFESLVLC